MRDILMSTINLLFMALILVIFARVILSWVPQYRYTQFGRVIFDISEPILRPIQNIMPSTGMMDFSPMVATFLLYVIWQILAIVIDSLFPY